jgi:hypothetical protein
MHVERHPAFRGDLAPDAQRIADEAGSRVADFRRVARKAGVSLAINLDVVRPHLVEDRRYHFRRRVFSDLRAIGAGVEIEVNAEEALGALQTPGRVGSLGGVHFCRSWQGRNQEEPKSRLRDGACCVFSSFKFRRFHK